MSLANTSKNSIFLITPFDLKIGEILLLFIPTGKDIRVFENLEMGLHIRQKPYWVKFILDINEKKSIKIINENITHLSLFLSTKHKILSINDLKKLSGIDIRIINMFVKRKIEREVFFEVNTAGLSINSIRILFNFILSEMNNSNYKVTYLIIEPNEKPNNTNPISISESNIEKVFDNIYKAKIE